MPGPAETSWSEAACRIADCGWRRVLVLGPSDAGKSWFCRHLCDRLLAAGRRVAVVDADIGQKIVGPPAAVTLCHARPGRDLFAARAERFAFVGATGPIGHFLPLVVGAARLVAAAQADVTIIDTGGLVGGPGFALKLHKIAAVRPDGLVAIDKAGELAALLRAHRHIPALRLAPAPEAGTKSTEARRAARARRFLQYFAEAAPIDLALAQIVLQPFGCPSLQPGLLCGVADGAGGGLGLARVEDVDEGRGALRLSTPVAAARIRILQLGALRIGHDGRDYRWEEAQ
ncbi:MAG TPA: polynucleotide 5'-hydroxyl-kinase [Stellaceae bacterium]|nr:polynucleotide 5'-hydroxyl-kinase [Stellaceae bacterium]